MSIVMQLIALSGRPELDELYTSQNSPSKDAIPPLVASQEPIHKLSLLSKVIHDKKSMGDPALDDL